MSKDEIIIVKDACILFDLLDLKLIEVFYQLEFTVITTPQVINEITDESQLNEISRYIINGKLLVDKEGTLESITLILAETRGLSLTDGSVLELAVRKKGMVLSSDSSLRNESSKRNLIVHGLLWVIEELHNNGLISLEVALNKLKNYSQINERAPLNEIQKLIQKLNDKFNS